MSAERSELKSSDMMHLVTKRQKGFEMARIVDFEKVLKLFEENGWVLWRIWPPYRVFINPKDKNSLPFLIPVEGKKVHERYYQKVKWFFKKTEEG